MSYGKHTEIPCLRSLFSIKFQRLQCKHVVQFNCIKNIVNCFCPALFYCSIKHVTRKFNINNFLYVYVYFVKKTVEQQEQNSPCCSDWAGRGGKEFKTQIQFACCCQTIERDSNSSSNTAHLVHNTSTDIIITHDVAST